MNVEVTERVEYRGRIATVTDTKGRVAVKVTETANPIDGKPLYHAVGGWLANIDGDSLAIRTLYAADLPAAVAEARTLLVREVADHAKKMQAAFHELDASQGEARETDLRQPGPDGDLHRAQVGAAAD
jgi:hypothetical protein